MQIAYLINNQIGASSKKVYGLKGDKVQIITHSINMRLVQNESGQRYWVNVDNLSEAPVPKNIVNEIIENIKSKKKRV